MRRRPTILASALVALALLVTTGCSASDGGSPAKGAKVVVTTSILGDVVEHLVGNLADVEVIMPPGAGPHDFQASAKQAVAMREADVLIENGLGFEGGLLKAVDAARSAGVDVYDASSAITPLVFGEELGVTAPASTPGEEPEHPDGAKDPHFFTDPSRMVLAARGIAEHLRTAVPALDTSAFRTRSDTYIAELRAADTAIGKILAPVPTANRKLVTNHDVFGYFAQHYDFRVVGAVIPSLSTEAEPSAKALKQLAATIQEQHVPAIFADTSSPAALADKLSGSQGLHVKVVELFSEALGPKGSPGATYIAMMTTDARRIAAALG